MLPYALRDLATGQTEHGTLLPNEKLDGQRACADEWSLREGVPNLVESLLVAALTSRLPWARFVHAAAVVREGAGLLLCGDSGRGKTTLAVALTTRGYQLVNDDMACLRFPEGRLFRFPRVPRVRAGSARLLSALAPGLPHSLPRAGERDSFGNGLGGIGRVRAVIFLQGFAREPRLERLPSGTARPLFVRQVLARPQGNLAKAYFELCQFLQQADCYTLTAGDLRETLDLLDARLGLAAPAALPEKESPNGTQGVGEFGGD
jgi:hypothetical protein